MRAIARPFPSYGRSNFPAFDDASGLLSSGKIPGLEETSFNGAAAIRYKERIISPSLWVEDGSTQGTAVNVKYGTNSPHSIKGLLTHRKLDVSPGFGITTYTDSRQLDGNYQVFGRVLYDDDSREFFERMEKVPKYTFERPSSENVDNQNSAVTQMIASEIFEKQKKFFRNAAKTVGAHSLVPVRRSTGCSSKRDMQSLSRRRRPSETVPSVSNAGSGGCKRSAKYPV